MNKITQASVQTASFNKDSIERESTERADQKTADPAASIYKNGDYLENNSDWHSDESPWKVQHILNILTKNHCSFDTVTEVGCGAGKILQLLKQALPEKSFTGFDISPQAASFWQNVPSDEVSYRLEDFLTAQDYFDLLLLIDVFEHVPDYMGFLKQLRTRADQFVFHIPLDMNTLMTVKGEHRELRNRIGHIHYFSKETALATLEDCGYEILDCFYTASYLLPGHERSINPLRTLLFKVNPDLVVNLLGGWSLMVLAKPAEA